MNKITIHREKRIWDGLLSSELGSLQGIYKKISVNYKNYMRLKVIRTKMQNEWSTCSPSLVWYHHRYIILPNSWIWAIIITVVILQIIDALKRKQTIKDYTVNCHYFQLLCILLIQGHMTYHTQAAKILASCSSWPSEPGIVLLQVKYLQSTIHALIVLF